MIEYFHFKPVLAFQLAHGDMFRAQGHLLTPSELRDTPHQRLNSGEFARNPNETMGVGALIFRFAMVGLPLGEGSKNEIYPLYRVILQFQA